MTLGNMRANGVRSLAVTCLSHFCHHDAVLDVMIYRDDADLSCGCHVGGLVIKSGDGEPLLSPYYDHRDEATPDERAPFRVWSFLLRPALNSLSNRLTIAVSALWLN
jgi:hypothetical protein